MSDRENQNVPFEGDTPSEQKLWAALEDLPRTEPSPQMRRTFYNELDKAANLGFSQRLRAWLGIGNNRGWLTVTACLVVGVVLGQALNRADPAEATRLVALEQNIALLNRELILDRLSDSAAGNRLRGVLDASSFVQDDAEIARALLLRATEDRVTAVRSAAIDALGPSLNSSSIGDELMQLLQDAESPIVQLALVDLVLRNGSQTQLQQLLQLANDERLHPDLAIHVKSALGVETI